MCDARVKVVAGEENTALDNITYLPAGFMPGHHPSKYPEMQVAVPQQLEEVAVR